MNFTKKMEEIEKTLKLLESDSIPLEEAILEFEKGIGLIKDCKIFLEQAKQKVSILTDDGETLFNDRKD